MTELRRVARQQSHLLLPLLLFLGTFSVYALTTEREAVNTDAYAASAGAWRIATAGTPWFDGLDVEQIDGTHTDFDGDNSNGQWLSPSANGHVTAQRMPGPILAGVPFYWILADGATEADFSLLPGGLAASALSAGAVTLMFLALRTRTSLRLASAGALAFAFATPTWTVSANGLWTHPVTQLGIVGAAYASARNRWWWAGLALGIAMWGRPHVALIAAVLGLGVAWTRRRWQIALAVALPTLASLGALAVWNRTVHGRWSLGGAYTDAVIERAATGAGAELGQEQLSNYLGFLVSADRGFLVWTPVVLVLLPALLRARRSLPDWALFLLLGGVVYTFFQLRLNHFAGGVGFYGYRHGLELLAAMTPALVLAVPYAGRLARALLPPVLALQAAAMLIGAVIEGLFVDLPEVWTDNSLWLALREAPLLIGTLLTLAVAAGLLVAHRILPERVPSPSGSAVSERAQADITE
ncbi:hypothetical protein GCM10027273_37600 [Nocardioides pakistanensis]